VARVEVLARHAEVSSGRGRAAPPRARAPLAAARAGVLRRRLGDGVPSSRARTCRGNAARGSALVLEATSTLVVDPARARDRWRRARAHRRRGRASQPARRPRSTRCGSRS
jgi:hypothetical protein